MLKEILSDSVEPFPLHSHIHNTSPSSASLPSFPSSSSPSSSSVTKLELIGEAAASGGHLELLRWALDHHHATWTVAAAAAAARHGHLDILKLAAGNRETFGAAVYAMAARGGHLHVLKWLHEEGGVD